MLIPEYIQSIFKIILVLIIILGMIVLLLGINHLSHNDDSISEEETEKLKSELTKESRVISPRSVFHRFLARSDSHGKK